MSGVREKTARKCQILVLASGNGSNFQALCDGVASGRIPNATICRLIVNRGKAYATTRAENHGIPWDYVNLISHGFQSKGERDAAKLQEARESYDAALAEKVLAGDPRPDLIVLAGWMYIFGEKFLDPVGAAGIKVINLHPALPGQYDGAHAIERAFEDFQAGRLENNKTGIMVHNVIKQVDQGEAIMTREIECLPGDDVGRLTERIHSHEHELIVEATAKVVAEILART
ncbi:formyl transferase domain-containing protein [Hirsutella rhossiliensis]|uniref:Phosphoribosylglycinamide formyltransferase n=1 Tax=Hirsutella rhossiliensis TaxID=111463 RepID=A0A9P8SJM8_9HYPO|nr:formyl transferase domain-containing protein [Hirsutella rhossiliensis]KAH0963201.1 formyl transferase domain-containing protein [Hirsutella rhossiliensis]